jgi:hypothetical protein
MSTEHYSLEYCMGGHSDLYYQILTRAEPPDLLSGCTKYEMIAPIVFTTKNGSANLAQQCKNISFLQLSGMSSNRNLLSQHPRYAMITSYNNACTLQAAQIGSKVDLRAGIMPLLPKNVLSRSSICSKLRKHTVSVKTSLSRSISVYVDECNAFYNETVHDKYAETVDFVNSGGCIPMITKSDISEDLYEVHVLCSDCPKDVHGQGINAQLNKVQIPCLSAGPASGITREWAHMGGDPDIVPLQLSSEAVNRMNSVLYGVTTVQRAVRYLQSIGISNLNHDMPNARLIKRGYNLLPQVISNGQPASRTSSVYIDNFNPSLKEKAVGWCNNPIGGIQSIGSLVSTPGAHDCCEESGVSIPIKNLSNLVFVEFGSKFDLYKGLCTSTSIRSEQDVADIMRNPGCYGRYLHATQEYNSNAQAILKCRNYKVVDRNGISTSKLNSTLQTAGSRFHAIQMFGDDRRKNSTVTYQSVVSKMPSSGDPSIPFILKIRHNTQSGTDIRVSSFDDYVCAVSRNTHSLLVQTDAPELLQRQVDTSELSMLRDSVTRLDDAIECTANELTKKIKQLTDMGAVARLKSIKKQFDTTAGQMCSIPTNQICSAHTNNNVTSIQVVAMAKRARACIVPAYQLVQLAADVSDVCNDGDLTDIYNPVHDDFSVSSMSALKETVGKRRNGTLGIVASACLDAINALVFSVDRCVPYGIGAQPGSFSKIRAMYSRHHARLGPVKQVIVCGSSPRRGCILVRTGGTGHCTDQDDLRVLMMSRQTATDPEYFSTDEHLQTLKNASSVRFALASASKSDEENIHIGQVWKLPVSGRRKCHTASSRDPSRITNSDDPTMNCLKIVTLCVQWKPSNAELATPWNLACIQLNTCSTDRVKTSEDGRIQHNVEWGLRVLDLQA